MVVLYRAKSTEGEEMKNKIKEFKNFNARGAGGKHREAICAIG